MNPNAIPKQPINQPEYHPDHHSHEAGAKAPTAAW